MMPGVLPAPDFSTRLIDWQRRHGRHGLPWQGSRDPYRIWLSEIMLQQTQVAAVIGYYRRFLDRFPDVATLAAATLDEVLSLWSGLGYYARARHLHRAAKVVMERHQGEFPRTSAQLADLPGIGRSTAAAVAAFSAGERAAILDGNVKRVLARHFAVQGFPGQPRVERELWTLAETLLPSTGIEAYTQGLMDLGATVCTRRRPRCAECPLVATCQARSLDAVDRYPAPRPARVRPERHVTLWLLRAESEAADAGTRILLERRPPAGIWGGLWSLPEMLPPAFPQARLPGLALDPEPAGEPLRLTHGFTHFVLHITVQQRRLIPAGPAVAPGALAAAETRDLAWVDPARLDSHGLPAPVRALLDHLFGSRDLRATARRGTD